MFEFADNSEHFTKGMVIGSRRMEACLIDGVETEDILVIAVIRVNIGSLKGHFHVVGLWRVYTFKP